MPDCIHYKIITPPASEPLTLAEVKLYLRLNSGTFAGETVTNQSIAPGSHEVVADYGLTGTGVDVLGKETLANLNSGTCGSGGSISAKIQESDDCVTWTDYSDSAFTTITEANDNAVQEIEYTGGKQYVRVVASVSGAACAFGADVIIKSGDAAEDTLLESLITSAREYCESFTRRALASQVLEAYLQRFPREDRFELPLPPLQSVTSIKYTDSAGSETTMTESTDYIVDSDTYVGAVALPYGKTWPSFTEYPVNPIKVRYTAGYTDENLIPKSIKQAMLLHVGFYYLNRDAADLAGATERAITSLLAMWKVGWF